MFTQKNREIEHIPPSQYALVQHIFRTAYQAGHICGRPLERRPELPSPSDYGWMQSEERR
jgi:hypothetical protein